MKNFKLREIYPEIVENNMTVIASIKRVYDKVTISTCGLNVDNSEWTIYVWNTHEAYMHEGYGKLCMEQLMRFCFHKYGLPSKIRYIWNGQNEYVGEWLHNHFDAKSCCPLSVMKNNADDDWESHIYELDIDKVLIYFGLTLIKNNDKEGNTWYLLSPQQ